MSNVRAAVDAANRDFMANVVQQDAAGLAGFHTDSACVMPSNSDIVSGAANIQAFWQGMFDMGIKEVMLYPSTSKTTATQRLRLAATP